MQEKLISVLRITLGINWILTALMFVFGLHPIILVASSVVALATGILYIKIGLGNQTKHAMIGGIS